MNAKYFFNRNKLARLVATALFILSTSFSAPAYIAQAQTSHQSNLPLKVVGRFLQDANGKDLMMRGVNVPVYKSGWADDLNAVAAAAASAKVNVVRLEWWANPPAGTTQYTVANLDRAIQKYTDLGILPIIELHDLTFQYGHDAKSGPNSDGNDQALFASTITAFWTRPDVAAVLAKHQNYLVINLANEWGSSAYSDGASTAANFIQNYTAAIAAVRKAGINAPLMVDAPKGFEYQFILDNGHAILNADPQKNTMLSVHAYWAASAYPDATVNAILNNIKNSGLPIVLGEVSSNAWTTVQCDPVHYSNLLTAANADQISYLAWAWYEDGQCGPSMNITAGADGVTLPTQANPGFGYDALYSKVFGIYTLNTKANNAGKAPLVSIYTPPGLCPTVGAVPKNLFFDNMESGPADSNWVYGAAVGSVSDWTITSSGSIGGIYSLFGPDEGFSNDSYAAMKADVTLPSGTSYLYFNHKFDFEFFDSVTGYDGGVLEYSTDQGATWQDAHPLFSAGQDYNMTISNGNYGSPLQGKPAFSGNSGGIVASRYDLTGLAGKSVRFRWRTGSDSNISTNAGWYVDDVEIYRCIFADTVGVFRPSNGALYLKNSNTTGFADNVLTYGLPGDYPVVGDWDGNGSHTIGVYRNGIFYLRNSNTNGFADIVFAFGSPGDQPVAGDWTGKGFDTVGVYRSSTGTFFLRNSNSSGPPDITFSLGVSGDVGIAGDWTGKGFDTTGVFRPSNGALYLKNTNATGFADLVLTYGLPGDMPVTGDWNGDGIDTIGVYRNNTFYLRNSNTNGFADITLGLGINGDIPIAGYWGP